MRNVFVQTENVNRFLAAIANLDQRGAPEACWVVVTGDAGHGKTQTGIWWSLQNNAINLRLKAAVTPHWLLTDLVRELGENAPANSCEKLFAQAFELLARDPRPIVVDEVENAIRKDMAVLETLRDLSDLAEFPVILFGRENVKGALRRQRQIWTRIAGLAEFGPASREDVSKLCAELAEVTIGDELVEEIHRQSEGHIRQVVKAIKTAETAARRNRADSIDLAAFKGKPLCHDFQRRERREVA